MIRKIAFITVLDDGKTYSSLDGSTVKVLHAEAESDVVCSYDLNNPSHLRRLALLLESETEECQDESNYYSRAARDEGVIHGC
jgi:hypothetical protein